MKSVNAKFSYSKGANQAHSSHDPKISNKSKTSFKSSTPGKVKMVKIPRPPNSFILYRKDNAYKYGRMVATELSAKMALAWRRETPERRKYYANLAKLAKENHKLMHPDYKFTPVQRGTGKLAMKAAALKAAKETAMEANHRLPVQAGELRQISSGSSKRRAPKKTSRSFGHSALATPSPSPSASSSPSPPPEIERTTPANRPRRNIQRPERFSPCGYRERPFHSGRIKSTRSPDPECSVSPSLFFSNHSEQSSSRASKTIKSSVSSRSLTCATSSQPCQQCHEGSSDNCVDFEDLAFSDASLSSEEDDEDDSDYGTKRMTLCSSDVKHELFSRSECAKTLDRPRSSSFQSQEPLFFDTTFTSPYTLENFEPECLPRSDYQWPVSTLLGSFGAPPAGSHVHPSQMLFSEYILTPGLEEPIIDFAEYANFDAQDNADVKVEAGSSESGSRPLNLTVDPIASSVAAAASGPSFPMDSRIPLSLLSLTTETARAMENMTLSSAATSSDKDDKTRAAKEN
ncbi:hypothetical protein BGZ97_004523 [Linnemannia gamsii]|uniref:HMG box domain-containing protein n=1 Tax=Linnemannia gamsii TaxID=64522 RepID=A0A9P6UT12_9FUNG|nr:hypothetical protein BGZ97_004523 [Linnemannia gamsii]